MQQPIEPSSVAPFFHPRDPQSHKGTYGHALLCTGSYGMMGAASLAAKACLRSGIGKLTAYIPPCGYEIMQMLVPEALSLTDPSTYQLSSCPPVTGYQAIGVGPGLGTKDQTNQMLQDLLRQAIAAQLPTVVDADALNLLSMHPDQLTLLPPNAVITPHMNEFRRLLVAANMLGTPRTPKWSVDRVWRLQEDFAKRYHVIVVLKGWGTHVASPEGEVYVNTTGNPGMATGGSGDVLTGVVLALLAQHFTPLQAAVAAVYVHGLAGDLAASRLGEISLLASDIVDTLPEAFQTLIQTNEN